MSFTQSMLYRERRVVHLMWSLGLDLLPLKLNQKELLPFCESSPNNEAEQGTPVKEKVLACLWDIVWAQSWIYTSFKDKTNSALKNTKVYYICAQTFDLLMRKNTWKSVIHRHQLWYSNRVAPKGSSIQSHIFTDLIGHIHLVPLKSPTISDWVNLIQLEGI